MSDDTDPDIPVDWGAVRDAYGAIEGVLDTQRQAAALTAAGGAAGLGSTFRMPAFDLSLVSEALSSYSTAAHSLADAGQFVTQVASTVNRGIVEAQRVALQAEALIAGVAKAQEQIASWASTPVALPPIEDLSSWLAQVRFSKDDLAPTNLTEFFDDLEAVATLASTEGVPLSWVPRSEIVAELLRAVDPDRRAEILRDRRRDILDDCDQTLAPLPGEWAKETSAAVAAMRAGLEGPAQSHAANIFDSIILHFFTVEQKPRDTSRARKWASDDGSGEFGETPFDMVCEALTLRPISLAYARWFPGDRIPPPPHFARHVTAHGVGYAGVFSPDTALTSVMLATSLCAQYSDHRDNPPSGP